MVESGVVEALSSKKIPFGDIDQLLWAANGVSKKKYEDKMRMVESGIPIEDVDRLLKASDYNIDNAMILCQKEKEAEVVAVAATAAAPSAAPSAAPPAPLLVSPKCSANHDMIVSDYSEGGYTSGYVCDKCRGQKKKKCDKCTTHAPRVRADGVVVDYVCDMCLVTSIPVTDTFSDSATELESIKMVGERWFCKECSSDICLKCAPKVIAIQSYAVGFKHSKGRWTKMVEEDWFEEFQSMGIPFCDIDRLMWAASGTIADALTMWQKEKEASNQAQKEMDAAIAALADPFGNDEVGGGDY